MLAGLASVALVTFFDERTPVELIREIRPDLYVKGGDYDMETLEETWSCVAGRRCAGHPFVDGYSTTSLVKRIRAGKAPLPAQGCLPGPRRRDQPRPRLCQPLGGFQFVPGAIDAMRRLKEAGYALVIVTNQSGIARGYYTEEQYQLLTAAMRDALTDAGAAVEAVYHCPHHPNGQRRRPGHRLRLPQARARHDPARRQGTQSVAGRFDPGRRQKPSDIEAARAAGVGYATSSSQTTPSRAPASPGLTRPTPT